MQIKAVLEHLRWSKRTMLSFTLCGHATSKLLMVGRNLDAYVTAQATPAQSKFLMTFTLTALIRRAHIYSTPLPLPRICLSLAPTYATSLLKLPHPNRSFTSAPIAPLTNGGRITKETLPSHQATIPVLLAIQGHPESPRLWEKHADSILRELGLNPTTHEPCLVFQYQ
jgi:hypothetical protein